MVTVGKIFARQGEIHLCFRLQLKITDLMFNLNINKKTAPLPTFLPAEGCFFLLIFSFSLLQKVAPAILQSERIPFSVQVRCFHGNQVDICVHRFGDFLRIEALLYLCIFCLPAYADPVSTPDNVSVLRFSSTRFVEYKFEIGQNGDAYIGASIVPIDRSHSCKIVATVQSKVNGKWKNIYSTSAQGDGIALLQDTSQTFSVGGTYCCVYDFYVYDGNTLLEHITKIESQ